MGRLTVAAVSVMFAAGLCGMVVAGSIDAPGAPTAGSGMYTLSQIYDYIVSGTALTVQSGFQEPTSAPASTMKTMKEIGDALKSSYEQCATTIAANVESGKPFFCTQPGSWGVQTGTALLMPTPTPSPTVTPTSSLYGGLVVYWAFNETSGTLYDSKGNVNLTGQTNSPVYGVSGIIGNGVSFDSSGDLFYGTDNGVLDFGTTTDFTFNLWVYQTAETGDAQIWSTTAYADSDKVVGTLGDSPCKLWVFTGGWSGGMLNVASTLNAWTMYTYMRNNSGTDFWLYRNGVLAASGLGMAPQTGNSSTFYLGDSRPQLDRFPPVKVDEFGIWNRALSSSEINELWNGGNGKAPF
ncbi:MAG: hypothetical protein NTZ78_09565 [Candidatus Aureabacteria bacterium]|nr:hypothetical protein [Candidatus Auribacterota bacterium]